MSTSKRIRDKVVINDSIQQKVRDAAKNPVYALLIDFEGAGIVVGTLVGLVIDHRKQRETDVRKHEEVAKPLPN